ncbi:Ribose import ATP-binding protein RbsA [Alienimonas californiensis]|uniref:Ribose import ATP-binding protein RbsA n=2 Tax=Alienimonas californiensis TaxID=2527989 RepID=A0A517P3T2_9PLAN|nr:Ribose import ATP-binding protein RbsA [Alienimonas californiensis]
MAAPAPLLAMHAVSKRYGPTVALDDVSLAARPGRVLALIGENGAGKSTLMKVLAGAVRPDAGRMTLAGASYAPAGPTAARAAGVAMIYQELNLAPDLSVEDNLMLGRERSRFGFLSRSEQRRRCRAALDKLGHGALDVRTPVGRLPVGTRQVVEIARAVLDEARVVVFDEPTSSLPRREAEALFAVLRTLTEGGAAVIYISHFLEEVRTVCDDYAVLRDGRAVGSGELKDVTEPDLVALMVGRTVDDLFPRVPHTPGEPLLTVNNLTGADRTPEGASLTVRRGEILGVSGLIGAGRTELLRAIYGLDAVRSGRITVSRSGAEVAPGAGPRGRIRSGVGFVSEDRAGEGLMLNRTLAENATLGRLGPLSKCGLLNPAAPNRATAALMQRLGVKARGPGQTAGELSGGNQQKIAVARVLHQDSDVWLLDEPTRGIDVGAKSDLYRLMGEAAAAGKAVLFVSSYLPELLAVCDRVAVMRRGELVAVRPAAEWTAESAMAAAVGADSACADTVGADSGAGETEPSPSEPKAR